MEENASNVLDGIPNVPVNSDRPATCPRVVVPSSPTSSSLLFPALADVVVSSTAVATIEQRARKQGFWEQGDLHWSGQPHRCAEKEVVACPVRNLDIEGGNPTDARRLEIVVDGLTIFDGAQLAIDTTMVSPLQRDGTARRRASDQQWRSFG